MNRQAFWFSIVHYGRSARVIYSLDSHIFCIVCQTVMKLSFMTVFLFMNFSIVLKMSSRKLWFAATYILKIQRPCWSEFSCAYAKIVVLIQQNKSAENDQRYHIDISTGR